MISVLPSGLAVAAEVEDDEEEAESNFCDWAEGDAAMEGLAPCFWGEEAGTTAVWGAASVDFDEVAVV